MQRSDSSALRPTSSPTVDLHQVRCQPFSQVLRPAGPAAGGLDDAVLNPRVIEALFTFGRIGCYERTPTR